MNAFSPVTILSKQSDFVIGTPVLLEGIKKDCAAVQKWNEDYFISHYGETVIRADRYSSDQNIPYFLQSYINSNKVAFKEVFNRDLSLSLMENIDFLKANPELLNDIDFFKPLGKKENLDAFCSFWYAPSGKIVDLHTDDADLFLLQVSGEKVVRLIPPSQTDFIYQQDKTVLLKLCFGLGLNQEELEEAANELTNSQFSHVSCFNPDFKKYPLYQHVSGLEANLSPGDVLYIPKGWWHATKAKESSFGLNTVVITPNISWKDIFTHHG